jgi:hypothetical protein
MLQAGREIVAEKNLRVRNQEREEQVQEEVTSLFQGGYPEHVHFRLDLESMCQTSEYA